MKRRGLWWLVIAALLVLLIFIYTKYFNGSLIYVTTGFKNNQLMKCEGDVTYTFEAKILISDAKKEYEEMFGSDIWKEKIGDSTFDQYILDQVSTKLKRVQAMNVMAEERGVVLGRDENNGVKDAVDDYYNGLTADEIKALGVDKDKLTKMFERFAIADKLYEDITSGYNIEVSSDEARVIDIQYIASDSEDEVKKAYLKISEGSSFFAVAKEINSNGEYEYELRRGEMNEEFEDIAYNLSTGEMSEVFECEGRYYIIRCTSDNDKTKTEANKSVILEQKKLEKFNESFEKIESDIYMEWNDSAWNSIEISKCSVYTPSFEDLFNKYLGG